MYFFFFPCLLKNNWAVLTLTRNVVIYYCICSLLACTVGIFESHVYMLLKIPAHISYRLCHVRSTQLEEAFHDVIKLDFSVQVKMLLCHTVLCVAYQIRAPLRAFGQYKEEFPPQLGPELQAFFRQWKLKSSKRIIFESKWYSKENLHIYHWQNFVEIQGGFINCCVDFTWNGPLDCVTFHGHILLAFRAVSCIHKVKSCLQERCW